MRAHELLLVAAIVARSVQAACQLLRACRAPDPWVRYTGAAHDRTGYSRGYCGRRAAPAFPVALSASGRGRPSAPAARRAGGAHAHAAVRLGGGPARAGGGLWAGHRAVLPAA